VFGKIAIQGKKWGNRMHQSQLGVSRDRTGDLLSFRGGSLKLIHSTRDTFDSSMIASDLLDSPLEPFFQRATETKQEILGLYVTLDNLLKKDQECLRPAFGDSSVIIVEINSLTASINARMQSVSRKINSLTCSESFPMRATILSNIRRSLTESFKEFSTKFSLNQQAFSASFLKSPDLSHIDTNTRRASDFDSTNFGTAASDQRQIQLRNQRQEEDIQNIAGRAEEIRNIFIDLATMIHDQGTMIDRIDVCIHASLANAREAGAEIERASRYQKKSRMWICVVILVILIVILFIMALSK
jgi:hypothetical protein